MPTDRELLAEIHEAVKPPVLFPGIVVPFTEDGPILAPQVYLSLGLSLRTPDNLMIRFEAIDQVSFRYLFEMNGQRSVPRFAQLCKVEGAA